MSCTNKRSVTLCGRLLSLKVGENALICRDGKIVRTGIVVSIQSATQRYVRFETRDSRYCVVPVPDSALAMWSPAPPFCTPAERISALPACA